jgi:transposase
MVRALRTARQTTTKARTQTVNAIKALLVTAPAELREQLRKLPARRLVRAAARLDPGELTTPTAAAKLALRALAGRHLALDAEVAMLDAELDRLTATAGPGLRALFAVGPENAAALLLAAGDDPDRLRSEAAFSMLCGSSPVEASSGRTARHRLM